MARDEGLVARVRGALAGRQSIGEVRMFGGMCFTLNRNMLCGVDRARLMFRVGKDQYADALARPGARPIDITGKPMAGFVFVDPAKCDARALKSRIGLAESYVSALPLKKKKKPGRSNRSEGRLRRHDSEIRLADSTLRGVALETEIQKEEMVYV